MSSEIDAVGWAALKVASGEALKPLAVLDLLEQVIVHVEQVPATQHPLGFLHLDLSGIADRGGVRLHVWNADFQSQADDLGRLHDHTWELRSAVLAGALEDHVLVPRCDAAGAYVAHRVVYRHGGNLLVRDPGRWTLEEIEVRKVEVGHSYWLPPGAVHRTEVSAYPTSTLVVATATDSPGPTVYTPVREGFAEAAKRRAVDPQVVVQTLNEVAAATTV